MAETCHPSDVDSYHIIGSRILLALLNVSVGSTSLLFFPFTSTLYHVSHQPGLTRSYSIPSQGKSIILSFSTLEELGGAIIQLSPGSSPAESPICSQVVSHDQKRFYSRANMTTVERLKRDLHLTLQVFDPVSLTYPASGGQDPVVPQVHKLQPVGC